MTAPGWVVSEGADGVHVVPVRDLRSHELDATCGCGPRVLGRRNDHGHRPVVVHNSRDGREHEEPDHHCHLRCRGRA